MAEMVDVPGTGKRIGLVCPPNFMRSVMTLGGLTWCFDNGIRPVMITGASGGACVALSVAEWNAPVMAHACETWMNLRPTSISKARTWDKVFLLAAACGALSHLIPNKKNSSLLRVALAGLSLGLPAAAFYKMLEQSSLFSSDPLGKLFEKNLCPERVCGPDSVPLAMVAAERNTGKRIIHTNFLPGDRERPELLIPFCLMSATIPIIFDPRNFFGHPMTDGARARQDPMAIDFIEQHTNPDTIVVFLFYELPRGSDQMTILSSLDQDNELVVRDKLMTTLDHLPPTIKEKVVIVMADTPPRKIGLHHFTRHDLESLYETGYRTMEKYRARIFE